MLVALSIVGVGLAWALSYAPTGSPDDDFHQGSIWCAWGLEQSGCTPLPGTDSGGQEIVSIPAFVGLLEDCWVESSDNSAECAADDPSDELRANSGAYPGGFYAFFRAFVTDNTVGSVVAMRLISFAICVGLIAGAALFISGVQRWRALLYITVGAAPLGLFIAASLNPSGVSVAALVATFLGIVAITRAPTNARAWAATAFTAAAVLIASQSRSDTVYFAGILAVAAGALALPLSVSRLKRIIAPALTLGALLLAILLTRSSAATRSLSVPVSEGSNSGPLFAFSRVVSLPDLYVGEFAQATGWLDVTVPALGHVPRTLAIGAIIIVGAQLLRWNRALALAILIVPAILLPLLWLAPQDLHVGVYVQPRYLLPLVGGALVILALDLGGNRPALTRSQALLIAGLASVANAVSLHATIRRFTTGEDVYPLYTLARAAWWWDLPLGIGPNDVFVIGSASFLVVSVWLALRASRTEPAMPSHSGSGTVAGADDHSIDDAPASVAVR